MKIRDMRLLNPGLRNPVVASRWAGVMIVLLAVTVVAETGVILPARAAEETSREGMGFALPPDQSVFRAEAGAAAAVSQVLPWKPELDRAVLADGYDYVVDGTVYRWNEQPGAAVWYNDSGVLNIDVTVPSGVAGTLRLFMWDYTKENRSQVIEVERRAVEELASFKEGRWLEVPVTSLDTQDGVISVSIRRISGPNPILQAMEFVPAPLDVAAGLKGPVGQVLEWNAQYDLVYRQAEGFGYSVEGTIYRWDETTAVWYRDKDPLLLHVRVPAGATGVLALYLAAGGRAEKIALDGNLVGTFSDFGGGMWVPLPVSAAESADGSLEVTVELVAGANAVVNRLQFVPGKTPLPQGPVKVEIKPGAKAPVGTAELQWQAALDAADLPLGYGYQVVLGNVSRLSEEKSAWVEPDTIQFILRVKPGDEGMLRLYMEDLDAAGRVQSISVQGRKLATIENFASGLWLGIPVDREMSATGIIGVAIQCEDGPGAILSGVEFAVAETRG